MTTYFSIKPMLLVFRNMQKMWTVWSKICKFNRTMPFLSVVVFSLSFYENTVDMFEKHAEIENIGMSALERNYLK